jgi:DNA polymerase-3 subunit delta'
VKAQPRAVIEQCAWPDWIDGAAVERLRRAIRDQQVNHAYLLQGPRGVGKSALSQSFAQALCCIDPDPGDRSAACGRCRGCRNVARGAHPDVEVITQESEARLAEKPGRISALGIDTIRRVRASVALMPLESSHRIVIFDDADSLPEPAQQALLKVLEEPPSAVIFLLLADEPESLLETVRSRCEEIPLRPAAAAAIETLLEQNGVQPVLAAEIAALSQGRPAWALAAARDTKALQARRDEREAARQWISASPYDRLVSAYKLGGQYSKRRAETVQTVQSAISVLRDEMIRLSSSSCADTPTPLFGADITALQVAQAVAASLRCLDDLERNVRPRLALEAMVLAWPNLQLQPT